MLKRFESSTPTHHRTALKQHITLKNYNILPQNNTLHSQTLIFYLRITHHTEELSLNYYTQDFLISKPKMIDRLTKLDPQVECRIYTRRMLNLIQEISKQELGAFIGLNEELNRYII